MDPPLRQPTSLTYVPPKEETMAASVRSQEVRSSILSSGSNLPDGRRPRLSVYEIVTELVIKELESGVAPWHKPWRSPPPSNLISKKPYRGINVFLLALTGYGSEYWLTCRHAQALGGNIRKGEHGTRIVFWKFGTFRTETADGETEERKSAVLRYYTVFNLEQTEGLGALLTVPPAVPIESAEGIVQGMPNPPAFEQDVRAAYMPSRDTVTIPSRTAFETQAEYYSTLFHELTHSTGHRKRLGREGFDTPGKFGAECYSREELIAEMGSAMLCGVAGIQQCTLANSAAYLKTWITKLKSDSKLLISAASAAQKAADYIRGESLEDSPAGDGQRGTL
jgi:antirestriction protein ArdC